MTEPNEQTQQPKAPTLTGDEIGVQYEGVGARPIMGFIFISVVLIALVVWVGINWAESAVQQAHEAAAMDLNYPDLRQSELAAIRLLNQYEVIDAEQGIYRIPIDRAIDLMVQEAYQAPGGNYSQELQLSPGN